MAEEIVGFKIQINGQEKVVKSLAEMRQLIKEANFELLSAQQNFGEYSNEAVQAAKKVASLKDSLQEAGETAQLFDPGKKFQAFAGALSAAAGGISAFQGALGLLGSESENVQKTLVKVQSALALSQGLSTIADSAKDFQRLAAVIQSTTVYQKAYNFVLYGTTNAQKALQASTVATSTAMRVLRGVMASIGIGALIFGVTTLITKIMEWTDRTSQNEKALKKQAEATKILNQDIDNQISVLTALGGKEKEIAAARKEQINNNLKDLRDRLKSVGKLTEEEQAEYRKLNTELKVIDINEANRKNKLLEENKKKTLDANKELTKQRVEDEKSALKALEDLRIENIQIEFLKNQERINLEYRRRVDEINALKIQENLKTQLIIEEQKKRDLALQENNKLIQKQQTDAAEIAKINDVNQKATGLNLEKSFQNGLIQIQKASADTKVKIEEQVLQLRKNQLLETGNAIQNLTSIVGKDTVAGKALGIATALINTYQGASEAIKQKSTLPSPFDVITKVINVGAIIATGLRTVKAITAVQVPGVGGGATPATPNIQAPIPPTPTPQVTSTLLNAQAIQQLGSATNRAYVLESDVTNSQERIRRINRAARLA